MAGGEIMNPIYSEQAGWKRAGRDAWMLDKLMLALHLGYKAGPAGVDVPEPGRYVVRPCVNAMGMGLGMQFCDLEKSTDHLPVGTFWCEVFHGEHISVDYTDREPVLAVRGHRGIQRPDRFLFWEKIPLRKAPKYPIIVMPDGPFNAEFIGGRLIEVHFRHNPDFRWGNKTAKPIYADDPNRSKIVDMTEFRSCPDADRIGFIVTGE